MIVSDRKHSSRWAIVLSAGNGERMRTPIERWLGKHRPKQYCAFMGSRSMLRHTVDRVTAAIEPDHIVTVIDPSHRAFLDQSERGAFPGHVIEQPLDRGTAAGIFLAAAHIWEQDPRALTLILPSDHFVFPESEFLGYLTRACELAERFEDQLFLLGAVPDRPETEYGWIMPSISQEYLTWDNPGRKPLAVTKFFEKPPEILAKRLLSLGCLWNTMVAAVSLQMLWSLGRRYLPDMVERFETYRQAREVYDKGGAPREHETMALAHAYQYMKHADFSHDILQQTEGWCGVLPMEDVEWCDWGHPARVEETLGRHGAKSAFSHSHSYQSDEFVHCSEAAADLVH